MLDITVCIPSIPPRAHLLERALSSVRAQTLQPADIKVAIDVTRSGASFTRHAALLRAETEWVAFLDDDDYFYPEHLETLATAQQSSGADYVFSWFDVIDGWDPFPTNFGKQFDPMDPHQTTITTLVRTSIAKQAGFIEPPSRATPTGHTAGEDWAFTLRCAELGAKFHHVPQRTWAYVHHYGNTSGLPEAWNTPHNTASRHEHAPNISAAY